MFCFPLIVFSQTIGINQVNEINRIAYCESKNDPLASNPNSSAKGRFQFLKGTWDYYGTELWGKEILSKNVLDYNDSTELAFYVFQKYGNKSWSASSYCWNSYGDT